MTASLIRPTACAWYSAVTACPASAPGDPCGRPGTPGWASTMSTAKRRHRLVLVAWAHELSYQRGKTANDPAGHAARAAWPAGFCQEIAIGWPKGDEAYC